MADISYFIFFWDDVDLRGASIFRFLRLTDMHGRDKKAKKTHKAMRRGRTKRGEREEVPSLQFQRRLRSRKKVFLLSQTKCGARFAGVFKFQKVKKCYSKNYLKTCIDIVVFPFGVSSLLL